MFISPSISWDGKLPMFNGDQTPGVLAALASELAGAYGCQSPQICYLNVCFASLVLTIFDISNILGKLW